MADELNRELGRLLEYVGEISTALRMCTPAYSSRAMANPYRDHDIRWLAESLHNLDMLGRALQHGDARQVDLACDQLIGMYLIYTDPDDKCIGVKTAPHIVFDRWKSLVDAEKGVEIFRAIKQAASCAKKAE